MRQATMQNGSGMRGHPRFVSVVIPSFNASATIADQLDGLAQQTFDGEWEVVIADNGSTDGTQGLAALSRERFDSLRIVDASELRGVSHARNVGARAARGDFIAVCDADDVVAPTWLAAMVRAAEDADIIAGALDRRALNDDHTWLMRPIAHTGLPKRMDFLPFAFGSNCGVWVDVFEALGGWNEEYAGGGDDVEFCWRAQLKGYTIRFAARAVVNYRYRPSYRSLVRQHYAYARMQPRLYKDFRAAGLPPRSLLRTLGDWYWVASRIPYVALGHYRRSMWLRRSAGAVGRVAGSIGCRVVYL